MWMMFYVKCTMEWFYISDWFQVEKNWMWNDFAQTLLFKLWKKLMKYHVEVMIHEWYCCDENWTGKCLLQLTLSSNAIWRGIETKPWKSLHLFLIELFFSQNTIIWNSYILFHIKIVYSNPMIIHLFYKTRLILKSHRKENVLDIKKVPLIRFRINFLFLKCIFL